MGNFLQILSGFTKGAADTYGKQAEEDRKTKAENDKLVASTLLQRAASPDITPEEGDTLLREGLKRYDMDKNTIEAVSQGYGFLRAKHDEENRKQTIHDTGGTPVASPAPEGPSVAPAMPVPGQQQSLGDIPSRTMGQIAFERNRPQVMQTEQDKSNIELQRQAALNQLQRESQRVMAAGELQDKLDLFQKYVGTDLEDEARQMLGMAPKGGGTTGVSAGRPIEGSAVKAAMLAQGKTEEANAIDANKFYMVQLGADRKTIVSALPAGVPTVSSKALVMDAATAAQFKEDNAHQPLRVGQSYIPLHNQLGGAIAGFIPESELGTISQHPDIQVLTDTNGNQSLVVTPVTTTTQKTAPGGQALPAPGVGPIPQTATQLPSFTAPPGTPAPSAGPTGQIPSLPVNVSPTKVPKAGVGNPRIIDTGMRKPLGAEEFKSYNAAQEGLNKIKSLEEMLNKDSNILYKAAVPGNILAPTFNRYKGELRDIISRVRSGAVLNPSEQEFYDSQLPRLTDLLAEHTGFDKDAVQNALKIHEQYFQRVVDQYGPRTAKPGAFGEVPKPKPGHPKTKKDLSKYER